MVTQWVASADIVYLTLLSKKRTIVFFSFVGVDDLGMLLKLRIICFSLEGFLWRVNKINICML